MRARLDDGRDRMFDGLRVQIVDHQMGARCSEQEGAQRGRGPGRHP